MCLSSYKREALLCLMLYRLPWRLHPRTSAFFFRSPSQRSSLPFTPHLGVGNWAWANHVQIYLGKRAGAHLERAGGHAHLPGVPWARTRGSWGGAAEARRGGPCSMQT